MTARVTSSSSSILAHTHPSMWMTD